MSSELSNQTERVVNHLIHPSERFNTNQVFAAAAGRASTLPLKIGGLRWHKLIGGTLLGLSSLLSLAALAANGGGLTERQYGRLKALKAQGVEKPESLISDLGKGCVKIRNKNIEKIDRWLGPDTPERHPAWTTVKTKLQRLSDTPNKPVKENYRRMGHIGYMTEHLYQYDKTTRALHRSAFLIYKLCNKTIPSMDKHLGQFMARAAKHQTGFLLANRGLLALTAIGWGVIAPLFVTIEVSLTMVGISACATAVVLLALAKLSAHSGGWRGDLLEPVKRETLT